MCKNYAAKPFRHKILKIILNVSLYIRNTTIRKDVEIPTIKKILHDRTSRTVAKTKNYDILKTMLFTVVTE